MNKDRAELIGLNWMIPQGFASILVDVAKADELFAMSRDSYLSKGTEREFGVRADFEAFAETVHPKAIHSPVVIVMGEDAGRKMWFIDGRHRFAVLRDAGAKTMLLATDENSKRIAHEYGILVETPKDVLE